MHDLKRCKCRDRSNRFIDLEDRQLPSTVANVEVATPLIEKGAEAK